jgi:hypothetical protein
VSSGKPRLSLPDGLVDRWRDAWPAALEAWSRFTRLRPPILCTTEKQSKAEGLVGSFAMIRFSDQAIVIGLAEAVAAGVGDFPLEILAHEIGHHVLAPANLRDHARCLARMRSALPTLEAQAPTIANLYTDLLINDRLQRAAGLQLAEVWRRLTPRHPSPLWQLYLRIYELLWSLERGALGAPFRDDRMEGDALLGMRVVRSYARDWVEGSGRFASLVLPYLIDEKSPFSFAHLADTRTAGAGGIVDGLVEVDRGELDGAIHPAQDPALTGADSGLLEPEERLDLRDPERHDPATGQGRTPYVYGEILRAAGVVLTDDAIAARYYRERALPHLVRFPSRRGTRSLDPLPEGLEPWDIGHPLDQADWLESVLASPHVVPGMTTVQRVWGTSEGREPERIPLDLDLYVDSSGSMPHPYHEVSYLTLAGAIMALSALRAGARVQAVLWSAKNQVLTTGGFVRDEMAILAVLCGFFGGGTQFPIPTLRNTYTARPSGRPAHIMVISDDGATTMFDRDERGNSGWDITAAALERATGGGSLVLNLPLDWEKRGNLAPLIRARDEQGWSIHTVSTWDELMDFAQAFSRRHYQPDEPKRW